MDSFGRILILFAIVLAVIGGLMIVLSHLGLGKLPGDVVIHRRNVTVYLPIASSILISVVLTLVINLFLSRK
ncbi:MAG TPA: DUF2905 domain-containing protein [Gaiellaceae bacterium]|nr:DUF2905 domain-containing protein [Gaiellaceae bacterium]